MKILVTGGSGFIGSNFIQYVLETTSLSIVNIDKLTYAGVSDTAIQYPTRYAFYQLDIGSPQLNSLLRKERPDYIINFAAETHVDRSIYGPDAFVQTNVLSTYEFIKAVQAYFEEEPTVRFLHVSTDEVYGQLKLEDSAFTEQTPYSPNSPYSATKAASDHLVRAFHHTYGLPAIITNCSNNYGPRQYPEKFVPVVIYNALHNRNIPVYGSGMNIRDWLYVKDHCEALYLILTSGKIGDKYNIGGNCEHTNLTVVRQLLNLMGKPESLIQHVEDRKGHDFRYAINFDHLKNTLGWYPKTSFIDGLTKTIDWYITHLDWMERCVHSV